MDDDAANLSRPVVGSAGSIADLFLAASQELAKSDARIYRSVDRHLRRTRELLAQEEASECGQQDPLSPGSLLRPLAFYRVHRAMNASRASSLSASAGSMKSEDIRA